MAEFWAGTAIGNARAINKMKKLGAISEETSKTPKELGVHESVLRKFEKLGWVRKTQGGRYYLISKTPE
jgi:hypothetical protein